MSVLVSKNIVGQNRSCVFFGVKMVLLVSNNFFGVKIVFWGVLGVKIVFVSVLVSNFVFLLLRHGTSDRGACEKSHIVFNFPFVMCCVLLAKVPFARCADTISLVISPFTWYMHCLYL